MFLWIRRRDHGREDDGIMKKAVKAGIIGLQEHLVCSIIPTYLMKYHWIIRDKKRAKKEEKVYIDI